MPTWIELKLEQANRLLGYLSPLRPAYKYDFKEASEKYMQGDATAFAANSIVVDADAAKKPIWVRILWFIVKLAAIYIVISFVISKIRGIRK